MSVKHYEFEIYGETSAVTVNTEKHSMYVEMSRQQIFAEHAAFTGTECLDANNPHNRISKSDSCAAVRRIEHKARVLLNTRQPKEVSELEWGLIPDAQHVAVPTNDFWVAWRDDKTAVLQKGYSVSKAQDEWFVLCPKAAAQPHDYFQTALPNFPPLWDATEQRLPEWATAEFRITRSQNGTFTSEWASNPTEVVSELYGKPANREKLEMKVAAFYVGQVFVFRRHDTYYRLERIAGEPVRLTLKSVGICLSQLGCNPVVDANLAKAPPAMQTEAVLRIAKACGYSRAERETLPQLITACCKELCDEQTPQQPRSVAEGLLSLIAALGLTTESQIANEVRHYQSGNDFWHTLQRVYPDARPAML